MHLVDLDLAFGRGENSELLARVIRETPVHVELSGGITSRAAIEAGLAMGPERVNVATQRSRASMTSVRPSIPSVSASPSAWTCAGIAWLRAADAARGVTSGRYCAF